jgi:hypothetical protein
MHYERLVQVLIMFALFVKNNLLFPRRPTVGSSARSHVNEEHRYDGRLYSPLFIG